MIKSVILSALAVSAAAAIAQAPGDAPVPAGIGPSGRAHEVVCVNQIEIGSRLARKRVCRTRAQWEQHRLQARENVERAQNQFPTSGG